MTQVLAAPENFALTPPETVAPVENKTAADMVVIKPEVQGKIDTQVSTFVSGLLTEDVHGENFRNKMDSVFRLGREEISAASSLMTGRFMERNFVGIEKSKAFTSLQEMRGILDTLNPGKQGDLMGSQKIFGIIPFGNKLQAYFRKYQSAGDQIQQVMTQVSAARDDMQKDAVEVEMVKGKLWESMQKLKGAIYFAQSLDAKVSEKVESLRADDQIRAKALEQEVLFYVRQNLQDMQTQMAVSVNGYLSLDVLKKTAREMVNGCNRVATTGMSALAIAQTVARATGNQIEVMGMLNGVSSTIGDLVTETSRQLGTHVEKTGEFAANPLIGIQKLQEMFDNTFKAIDAMDTFRSQAIATMGKNNQMLQEQIARSEQYIDRNRSSLAQGSLQTAAIEGPVKL